MVHLTIGSTKGGVGTTALTANLGFIVAEFTHRVLPGGAGACLSSPSQPIGKQAAAGLSRSPPEILSLRGFTRWTSTQLDRRRAMGFSGAPAGRLLCSDAAAHLEMMDLQPLFRIDCVKEDL